MRGLLSVQDSDDYYTFVLPKAQKVTMQLTSYFDYCHWEVRNADLEVIRNDWMYGSESAPQVSNIELDLKAGKYYVRIYRQGTGYYDLVVKPETILAKNVVLNRKAASIYKGSTLKLSATVSPSNTTNKKVTWRSSNTRVAKVNANGVVTGVGAGTAKITACTADGTKIAASCTVTVRNKTLTVNRSKVTLVRGKNCRKDRCEKSRNLQDLRKRQRNHQNRSCDSKEQVIWKKKRIQLWERKDILGSG